MSTRAEFRLTADPVIEESVFVRAKAIIDAHDSGKIKTLTEGHKTELRKCVAAQKRALARALKIDPNSEVEVSPMLARALEG